MRRARTKVSERTLRLHGRRRRHGRVRARQSAVGGPRGHASCCSRRAAATTITGSTFRSATSIASAIHAPIGATARAAEPGLNGRSLLYPRGRVLGGSSSINGMIYMRGQREDYDGWAAATGDASWGWDAVLPLFKRSEDHYRGASRIPRRGRRMAGRGARLRWDILEAFVGAGEQAGIPRTSDFNTGDNVGVGLLRGQPAPRRPLERVQGIPATRRAARAQPHAYSPARRSSV